VTNEALFLHFDEQLTSGLRFPAAYDENDLVFWLHFYSLFYDKLYIPANQLTDATPYTLKALQLCGIADADSVIRMPDGPVGILWDESRFPWRDFQTLFAETASDPMWCTARDPDASRTAAILCDGAPLTVTRADMTAELDPKESVAQLRADVFNAGSNCALSSGQLKRLQQCLSRIEERRDSTGARPSYSRNFYYAAFGYGRTPDMRRLADKFADITAEFKPLSLHFLTGVDYVSHSLKALFASRALERLEKGPVTVDVLMPDEYSRSVRSPKVDYTELAGSRTTFGELQPHPIVHTLDRNAIVGLRAKQWRTLHASDEYLAYRDAIHTLRDPIVAISETDRKRAERCLNNYLSLIAVTLKPMRGHYQRALHVIGRAKAELAGLGVFLLLNFAPGLPPDVSDSIKKSAPKAVEVFARIRSGQHVGPPTLRSPQQLPATFRLGKDIRVYLQ
jgi:hypothetical protein